MIKVVLLLECDFCGCSFNRASVCRSVREDDWLEALATVEDEANECGWYTRPTAACPACIREQHQMYVTLCEEPSNQQNS